MKASPNTTVVHGILRRAEPASDGFGGDVGIEVTDNASPEPAADFIRPEAGATLQAFYGGLDPAATRALIGRRVRVELTYNAGPGGGRAVVRALEPD